MFTKKEILAKIRYLLTKDRPMKEFVAYIVKNLVDNPDKVNIKEIGGTQTLIIELSVEKSDIGKIIGKRGKTINAIRTLLMSVASRNGLRVNLEILEEDSEEEASTEKTETAEAPQNEEVAPSQAETVEVAKAPE
ncbi:MAG: hypothetical protein SP4CHLAM5_08950 [Chlamydiia bacterium]|nr:hypothetical protein [Chlamydiia bacterium]MCH9618758.1 hypothetical protein [Chlamydiia bacterium]MCH9624441.1 hypothetical protein [Chlamydiia bacterium]